jgi:regulatory protein
MAGVITALEIQKRNKERVNVYLDDEYAFSLDIMSAATLRKGQTLSQAEIEALQTQDEVSRAVDRAVRFLSYRPRSVAEIRRNLAEKQTPEAVIDQAVERLQKLGYIDDRAFAAFWVENRNTFKPISPRALRYELRQKGVADADIAAALAGLDSHDAAYRAAQGQIRRHRSKSREEFRQKISAFLMRRGFGYDTIREVVEQWIAELETQDREYFTDDEE